jgi:cytochrome c553
MKSSQLYLITLLMLSPLSSFAADDTPIDTMMGAAKDMIQQGKDTAKEMGKSAADMAQQGKDAAKEMRQSAENMAEEAKQNADKVLEEAKQTSESIRDEIVQDFRATTIDQDAKSFKWTKPLIDAVDKGDPKKGEALAKEARCSKCHGDTGVSDEDDTPSIAGQIAAYSYKQLHDYKIKNRDDRDMLKKVKKLSNQDMIDISAWYATQKPEAMAGDKKGKKIPVLANKGDKKRFLIACDTCHDENAMKRGFQTPIIEGQKPEHFIETMIAFKEGDRTNDHYKLMQSIASRLTEDEIKELAGYYAAKPMEE